jgi:hypothetical protein
MNAPPDNRSITELFGVALSQLAKLFQNEVDLARAELAEKAGKAGDAIKFIGAGAIVIVPALTLVLFAAASELIALGLSAPLSYLATGVVAGAIALALILVGANRLSAEGMKPSVTLDQIRRDKLAAEELMR